MDPESKVMKKWLVRVCVSLSAVALLVWTVPLVIGILSAKALQGSFLLASCACGHDIFLLVEGGEAFDSCPGHGEKKLIGPVTRSGDTVTVLRAGDSRPEYEIKRENDGYHLRFLPIKDGSWHRVERITNPWRTTLRGYFPE